MGNRYTVGFAENCTCYPQKLYLWLYGYSLCGYTVWKNPTCGIPVWNPTHNVYIYYLGSQQVAVDYSAFWHNG
jgi:hypothetical protein